MDDTGLMNDERTTDGKSGRFGEEGGRTRLEGRPATFEPDCQHLGLIQGGRIRWLFIMMLFDLLFAPSVAAPCV